MGWILRTAWLNVRRTKAVAPPPDEGPRWGLASAALSAAVLVGAFVVVAIAIGVAPAAAWVAFGVSLATAIAGVAVVLVARRCRQRALAWVGAGISILATWTVIATAGVFPVTTERWIAFASGVAYFVAALGALWIHVLSPSRVVHVLEIRGDPPPAVDGPAG